MRSRELLEEVGIEAPLERLVKLPASPETAQEQTVLFRAVSDAVPAPNEIEVASLTYFTLDELRASRRPTRPHSAPRLPRS